MSDGTARVENRRSWTRRGWLSAAMTSLAAVNVGRHVEARGPQAPAQPGTQAAPLPLTEFQPKSMLHVAETRVARARFPVIDFHTHVSRRRAQRPAVPAAELVKTMDAVNLHTMVNLTGGVGEDLTRAITDFDRAFPRRFVSMTEPAWTRASEA